MIFVVVIVGIAMSKPITAKQQAKATEQIAQKLETKEENIESDLVNGQIKIHFIDVGQADSILIVQGNNSMLIDAGNNPDSELIKNYISKQGITKLDYIVGTHPHEDHIGGLDYIINSFEIGKIYMPKATSGTVTFEDVVTAIKSKGMVATVPKILETFKVGQATATILGPNNSSYKDTNNFSVVIRVTFGNNSFMFNGDAEDVSENEILRGSYNVSSDLLKVGHHGSDSSTTQKFLDEVNPKYAIISAGKNNIYGHPAKSTMEKLRDKGTEVYRTDENGTIVASSDGENITFSTKPGSYNYADETTNSTDGDTSSVSPKITPALSSNSKIIYHTPSGKSYHYDNKCRTLKRSKTILSQTLGEALRSSHNDPCDVCVE